MSTSSAVEGLARPHPLRAAKVEAPLIQDSLLPSGTSREIAFEVAFRFAPLGDGLHEMRNVPAEDLTCGKLEEIGKQCRSRSADDCLDFLFDQVREFSTSNGSHGDITAFVLKVPL
jgi:hypothetical protein